MENPKKKYETDLRDQLNSSMAASTENMDRSKYIFITATTIVINCENFHVEHDSCGSLLQFIGCLNVFEVCPEYT